jgi:hypothetical protein
MKTKRWVDDRAARVEHWGEGPWVDEPDAAEWVAHGYPCMIARNRETGTLCGYVAVPEGHPFYEQDGQDLDERVHAHGGFTFADRGIASPFLSESESRHAWWLGFDCGHLYDYMPFTRKLREQMGRPPHHDKGDVYRTFGWVKEECERIAAEFKRAEGER